MIVVAPDSSGGDFTVEVVSRARRPIEAAGSRPRLRVAPLGFVRSMAGSRRDDSFVASIESANRFMKSAVIN
jgi:hypothetical protein